MKELYKTIIEELALKSQPCLLINRGEKFSFFEMNSVTFTGRHNHYVYMVRNDRFDAEIERNKQNHKRSGLEVREVEYEELSSKRIEEAHSEVRYA